MTKPTTCYLFVTFAVDWELKTNLSINPLVSYVFIYWRLILYSPVNHTGSPQGFSLNQILQQLSAIQHFANGRRNFRLAFCFPRMSQMRNTDCLRIKQFQSFAMGSAYWGKQFGMLGSKVTAHLRRTAYLRTIPMPDSFKWLPSQRLTGL